MKSLKLTFILAGLATLGPFSIDTYFPSFPALGERFGVSLLEVQQTLSVYLLALAFMMLFHGALADSFGRRKVVLVALGVYTFASFACAFAPSFTWLLVFRALQGLSAGAGVIVGRAIIRDLFEGAEAQKLMAQVTMLFGLAPAIAPILGGYLHVWFGWQSIFLFLTAVGLLLFAACFSALPETLPVSARQPFYPAPLARNYLYVMRNPRFLALACSLGFGFGGFLLYVASASDFVLNVLGLTETEFGWMFIPLVVGLVAGAWLASRAAGHLSSQRMVVYGFLLMGLGAGFNVTYNSLFPAEIPWAVLPLVFYTLGLSLQAPVITILVLDLFPNNRGLAASLQGFIQTLMFAAISALVAPLVFGAGLTYAAAMAAMLGLNWLSWFFYQSRQVAGAAEGQDVGHTVT